MSAQDLPTLLRERLALQDIAIKDGHDHMLICKGEEQENARLAPLHELLIECVAALEFYVSTDDHEVDVTNWQSSSIPDDPDVGSWKTIDTGEIADKALNRLREGLKP